MKVAVPTTGNTLDDQVDTRFGRASAFVVFDTESSSFVVVDNSQSSRAAHGAGTQAAQDVVAAGADVVIAPSFGPRAFQVLKASGTKTYTSIPGTVRLNIEKFLGGELAAADTAGPEGHR